MHFGMAVLHCIAGQWGALEWCWLDSAFFHYLCADAVGISTAPQNVKTRKDPLILRWERLLQVC